MNFDDSDSDDSLLKDKTAGTRRTRQNGRKGKPVPSISMADIAGILKKDYAQDEKQQAEIRQLLKENAAVSNSELQLRVDKMTSTIRKNRKNNPTLQVEKDLKDGYDGAFPRPVFYAMQEIIATESSDRQGTLPVIRFTLKDEFFFDSKEKACYELTSILPSTTSKPCCELGSRLPALIQKNALKNFLRTDRFLTLLAAGDEVTLSAVQCWLFKAAASAWCSNDLAALGSAAFDACKAIQKKLGRSAFNALDCLESLLDCWLCAKPSSDDSSVTDGNNKNIMGLRHVLLLAATFCPFDVGHHNLGRILTQIMYIGLDGATTTTGFRAPINNLLEPIIAAVAAKQGDGFDSWCNAWSSQFVKDLRSYKAQRNLWLALPAAVRLVEMSWSATLTTFRNSFALSVLYECLGTSAVEEWLKKTDKTYLLKPFQDDMMWKSLTVSYYGLYHTLTGFDELKEQQTRLWAIVEAILLTYCNGISVYERKTNDDGHGDYGDEDGLRLRFISEFDRTTERLQGGKTSKITSHHIMRADYLLSIIHSNSTTLKRRLEERRSSIGSLKQSNLDAFFSSAKKPALSET